MAIIIELANAIDGFVDNPTTAREILADQIKRLIRSIRCKYNEAICDNEIIRRQNAEGVEQMVIADLHQLRANAQNQAQIFALQNNLPNQINMVGIPQPFFDWDDSIPDFLAKLRLYLQSQNVDLADNAGAPIIGKDQAIGYLRGCMRGRALEWFDEEITTKQNWELTNLLDNTGQANLVADEDWCIAGGHPTNIAINALNANAGTTVVVPGIRFGQAIWWLKTHFSTVEELEKAEDIGEHLTLNELAKKLYEIELRRIAKHKRDRIPDLLISQQASKDIYDSSPVLAPQQQGISLINIQKIFQ
ncbi:hypothetical protein GLOIN_2v1778046 [Rhizophagus clarus]|uniref:Uncharacterized protein n=1 Tax=Rhizophagus clarus TaxID=94130 RepID=A0A8H3QU18_9GLOM|nr:hypothetical protein GLOIN_2v1778046 [Rhizophagus clarus]